MIIRRATLTDVPAVARVHVDSWRTTYTGFMPDEAVGSLDVNQRIASFTARLHEPGYALFVAEENGAVAGFADVGPPRDAHWPGDAELYAIYLLAAVQGRGIGRALMRTAFAHARAQGWPTVCLRVLNGNSAEQFYRRLGGVEVAREPVELAGMKLEHIVYYWDAAAVACVVADNGVSQ